MREVIQIGDTLKVAVFHFLTRSYATRTNVLSDSSESSHWFMPMSWSRDSGVFRQWVVLQL